MGQESAPVSSGERAHNRSLVTEGQQLLALDHDYHVVGIFPSVCFEIDIPDNVKDSFYRGKVHITVKDKIFQPRSPLRHAVENVNIIRGTDGVDSPLGSRYPSPHRKMRTKTFHQWRGTYTSH